MELSFNLIIFIGWLFGIGYKVGWTDYVVRNKKEVFQLLFTLAVAFLFWFIDQFYLKIQVADKVYWRATAVIGYFIFGWLNLVVLLWIVKAATQIVQRKIKGETDKITGTDSNATETKP